MIEDFEDVRFIYFILESPYLNWLLVMSLKYIETMF